MGRDERLNREWDKKRWCNEGRVECEEEREKVE